MTDTISALDARPEMPQRSIRSNPSEEAQETEPRNEQTQQVESTESNNPRANRTGETEPQDARAVVQDVAQNDSDTESRFRPSEALQERGTNFSAEA